MEAGCSSDDEEAVKFLIVLALWGVSIAPAQTQAEPKYEMDRYVVVILRKGPKWTAGKTPESQKLQQQHLAHIQAMAKTGNLIVAGPFTANNEDARGIFIFKTTPEEAREMAEGDPAVKAGQLKIDVYPWMAARGLSIAPPVQ
jgi:uncharacterized protein YciI